MEIHQFFAGLDMDTIREYIGNQGMKSFPGAYPDGRNFRLYPGKDGRGGAIKKLQGTVEVPWAAPAAGRNTGMGAYWDERGDTLIAFIHNTAGLHSLLWHHPGEAQARTIPIPNADLEPGFPVTGCALINGEILVWTDGHGYPRMINLPRADSYLKKSIVRVYLPPATVTDPSFLRSFEARSVLNGVPQGIYIALPPAATAAEVQEFRPMVRKFADNWNNQTTLGNLFTAHACAEYIELEANLLTTLLTVEVRVTDSINGVPQQPFQCIVEYQNRYNDGITVQQMGMARIAPLTPPEAVLATDPTRKSSLIEGKLFQFQYAMHLKDKERTLTSPTSDIALPGASQCQNAQSVFNCIDVTFDDVWLNDTAMRGEIDSVDLFVREADAGAWFRFRTLEKWEWVYNRTFRFHNDGTYTASDSAYNEAGNTFLPPVANALETIVDSNDNTRVVLGGIMEGDDNPCVDIVLTPRLDAAVASVVGTATVRARILIRAAFDNAPPNFEYNLSQPIVVYNNATGPVYGGMGRGSVGHTGDPEAWGQRMPMGGWVMFAEGTDRYGISRQVIPVATYSGGSSSPTLWIPPANHPATGRNVFDGTQTGASLFPWRRTHRAAIRNSIEQTGVWSTIEVTGLQEGRTYVLRMASNLVDVLNDGSLYDINSTSRAWHGTSTRTVRVGSVTTANIKPGVTECTVTIPVGAAGTTIDIGDIEIVDTTRPGFLTGSYVLDGYLTDNLGTDATAAGPGPGVRAHRQLVATSMYDIVGTSFPFIILPSSAIPNPTMNEIFAGRSFSDHNGYWFQWQATVIAQNPRCAWLGVTGNPGAPSGTINGFLASGIDVTGYTIMNDINDSKWEGGLSGALVPVSGNLHGSGGWQQYIFANLNPGTHMRTHVRTRIVDGSGTPVASILAVLEGGGTFVTSGDGTVNIVAMGDVQANSNNRTRDRLILSPAGACQAAFLPSDIHQALITQFEAGNPFSETPDVAPWPNHYNIADFIATVTGIGSGRGFGRGSNHPVGYYLGRDNGDRTAVKPLGNVRFPVLTEDLGDWRPLYYAQNTFSPGIGVIDWAISGDVPIPWIGRWRFLQFVMARDTTREWFVQWVASQVAYSTIWDSSATAPTATSYASGNATEIYISLTDSFVRYGELHTDARSVFGTTLDDNTGYLWEEGDMLRVLTNRSQSPIYGTIVEVRVTGQRGRWITVAASSAIPQLFGGEVIEIFRPRKPTEDAVFTYYDIPGARILIDGHLGPLPAWSQVSGTLDKGATWVLSRQVPIRPSTTLVPTDPWTTVNFTFEAPWVSDFFPSTAWGRGKPWFQDPDAAVQDRGVLMRYTDAYKPGTSINGLNFSNGLNFRIVENWLGRIMVMRRTEDVIVCVCENGAFSIYVGVQQQQTTPAALLETVGGILGNVRPFAYRYGTRHRKSVVKSATSLFWFDELNGIMVYYNSNQLQDIATQNNMHSYFTTKAVTLAADTNVCAGWDMQNGDIIMSFAPHLYDDGVQVNEIDGESATYHDPANKYVCRVEYSPDFWGTTRQRLWSFADGKLLLHGGPGAVPNRVNGVDLELSVDIAVSQEPMVVKTLMTMWLARGGGWDVPLVTNDLGQSSSIPDIPFNVELREGGIAKYDFKYDVNTLGSPPRPLDTGDPMTATTFTVRLRHLGPQECNLLWVRFKVNPSNDTGLPSGQQ